jgi:phosphoglycolate phosphatase-like HAD superfamily hydrolase
MLENTTNLTNATVRASEGFLVFLSDYPQELSALATIITIILVVVRLVFRWFSQKKQHEHERAVQQSQQDYDKKKSKLQQAKEEMDNLISKLHTNLDSEIKFHKYNPYTDKKKDKEIHEEFWEDIKLNTYLTPFYLQEAIELYLKYQAFGLGKKTIKSYKEAEAKLRELIIQRYIELNKQIKDLEDEEI